MTIGTSRALVLTTVVAVALGDAAWAGNWPQWRGPAGDSTCAETGLPLEWGEESGIVWKCPLPGQGASTPAVWKNAVFVTAHKDDALLLLKVDKRSGRIDWTRRVGTGTAARVAVKGKKGNGRSQQKFHPLHNLASPSPVTDGERVIVHFGNGDLAAYDFAGRQLWRRNLQKDYGKYTIWWGHANSPVLYEDLVISVCMQDSLADLGGERAASYVVAHDVRTGKERWKTMRLTGAEAEQCDSYTTPVMYRGKNGPELVVMGSNQIDAYELATGRQRWFLPAIVGGRTITGPTVGRGLIYATQGMRGPLLAIRAGKTGQLPADAVVWKTTQGTPDSACPVVCNDLVFWVSDNGVAQCRDARTGVVKWQKRLPGDYKASPLAADGRIYFLNLKGLCTVAAAAPRFEKLASNQLDADTISSPAVSDGRIYLRGRQVLYGIGAR
ncbi:MAG TPA: PQQ-binding-like beta-propeller repeat protein [Gemmataceae bacterium]|jgi:outer membrane protein assembly factor BamB|nr:PQQ-binding-like beta-propeller repeat protein [Gemmataceae bacterium]